jgi:cytochrome c biogenesis protein CcmG, thiol:disulfide interchange protein DsbE
MKLNWPLLLTGAAIISALVYVLGHGFGQDPHEVPFMLTGKPAPDFALEAISEKRESPVKLADVLNKPLILNYWSTWCVPCKQEHPVLEWGHKKYGDKVSFVGVVYQDTRENVNEMLTKTPSAYLQLFDAPGRAAVDYGLAGVPETYFISTDKVIRYKHVGPISPDRLSAQITKLLAFEAQKRPEAAP